jgi:hypothetical protein
LTTVARREPLRLGIRCELRPDRWRRLTEHELRNVPLRQALAPWQRLLTYQPEPVLDFLDEAL